MRRALMLALTLGALFVIARRARPPFGTLMEYMAEHVMPGMMDRCFAQMDRERRESMLSHCRGMLDAIEGKYIEPEEDDAAEPSICEAPARSNDPRSAG